MTMEGTSFVDVRPEVLDRHAHMLEGIKHHSDNPKLNALETNRTAVMMENAVNDFCKRKGISYSQLKQMTSEANINVSADAAAFVKIQLPLIRKVYPNMISREFVSVQPMSQPTMKIFYHDLIRKPAGTSLSAAIHTNRTYADNEEYNEASPVAIAKIGAKITTADVSATEKKLMYENTVEAEQDFQAYHGISLDGELTAELGVEVTREWDRMILQDMLDQATGGTATFSTAEPASLTYQDRKYWMETLMEKIIDIDTLIFGKTYRQTNFIVVPHTIAGFMAKMSGFIVNPIGADQQVIQTGGRYFMGTLNSRWRVYVDPFFPTTQVLVGYNNPGNWMETAYVWSPYILSYFSDPFTDPETFVTKRAIMSRAAMKCVRPDYLGVLTISSS
jgi:hypothetical protein